MSIRRYLSRSIARLLVGVLVFAQAALSAYACPVVPGGSMSDMGPAVMAGEPARAGLEVVGMPADVWHLDSAQPNLCAAHCQSGQQNVDGKPAPTAPAALAASFYPAVRLAPQAVRVPIPAWVDRPPPAATPPVAILHCCFRI